MEAKSPNTLAYERTTLPGSRIGELPESWVGQRCVSSRQTEANDKASVRALIVEDLTLLRGALAALLAGADDMEIVGQMEGGRHVLSATERLQPDVAIVDVDPPESDGLATVRTLGEHASQCRILALAAAARPAAIRQVLDGEILGVLDKDAAPERLAESVRRVGRGERVIDPALVSAALCMPPNPLTCRELEVLRLASDGASAVEIAAELSLAVGTVRNYLSRVVTKTGARGRVDAIRIAREAAWL